MPIFFSRLQFGWPDELRQPIDNENSWRIYTACVSASRGSCTTRADIRALDATDKASARSTFVNFSLRAQTGQPLTELYDVKQCHEAHAFKVHEHDQQLTKIWRLWTAGKIRTYFIYLPSKRLVILKSSAKRENRLSGSEKLELEGLAKAVLLCIETHSFEDQEI